MFPRPSIRYEFLQLIKEKAAKLKQLRVIYDKIEIGK